jgi:hypothetical protein
MTNRPSIPIGLCACVLFSVHALAFEVSVNQHSKNLADFEASVATYLKLHNEARAGLPRSKPTNTPADITLHQRELAERIRALRPKAREGEIFTPTIRTEFHRLIKISWQGSDATNMKASLERSEPVQTPLQVNGEYPARLPLQSMPPTLLQNLPPLPKELEYRVVSHRLVLRDIGADLIVDFTDSFIP